MKPGETLSEKEQEKEKERAQRYIERLTSHKESSEARAEYAMKRLDVVIITLSSSGLLLLLDQAKDYGPYRKLLLIPFFFFIGAIVVNILSQWMGYYANYYAGDWAQDEIENEEEEERTGAPVSGHLKQQTDDKWAKSEKFTHRTSIVNITSTICLGIGIVSLLALFTFWVFC